MPKLRRVYAHAEPIRRLLPVIGHLRRRPVPDPTGLVVEPR